MQLASLVKVFEETGNDAILVDLGGRTDVQCWGSLLAEAAMIHGVRAALVNGAARDVGQLGRLGFPTFARGIHPASMRGRLAMVETECDVVIDGQPVSPGWAVAADSNGAIFFPREHAGKVFALAKEIATAERRLLEKAHEASESAATARRMLLS